MAADKVVGGSLAGGIGAVGPVLVALGEGGIARPQGAEDLVGRHVPESEGSLPFCREPGPERSHRLQEPERADDVRVDEVGRAVDRAVDVALGSEVDDGPDTVVGQQPLDECSIGDVAARERVPRILHEGVEIADVAGVGELVEIDHALLRGGEPVEHEVGADESGAAW